MVKDLLSRAHRYQHLGPAISEDLAHAASGALETLPDGRHQVSADVAVQIQRYTTKSADDVRWEAHRAHIDLQLLLSGDEFIAITPIERLVAEPYDAEKDLLWLNGQGDGDVVRLSPGAFVLLWPEDAHRPGIRAGESQPVRKVLYKIRIV